MNPLTIKLTGKESTTERAIINVLNAVTMQMYEGKVPQAQKDIRENKEYASAENSKTNLLAEISFVTLAENGNIDDTTIAEHGESFTEWASGVAYVIGNIRLYEDKLYKCVQAHTSQDDWAPDVTASLWTAIADPEEEYPEWAQPIGAHDAYNTGDKVSYNGKHYICTIDGNIWTPETYGWEEVTQ